MDTIPIGIDPYVLGTLMRDLVGHDRRPSAYLVYLGLLGEAQDARAGLSHALLAQRTGLSKRAVQDALAHLVQRKLIEVRRGALTEAAYYRVLSPWRR